MYRFPLLLLCAVPAVSRADVLDDVKTLASSRTNRAADRTVWDRVVAAGPDTLVAILSAWPPDDPVATHWLRTAFDDLSARHGSAIPQDTLLSFVTNAKAPGKARRLALQAVENVRPGTTAKLLPSLLNDREFGPDAVADRIATAARANDPGEKKRILRDVFDVATDVEQIQTIAKSLISLGEKPDVTKALGIVTRWQVVGPFGVTLEEGLKQSFPPESKIDWLAEYPSKAGSIRWKAVAADPEGKVDLIKSGVLFEKGAVAYAATTFRVSSAQKAELRISAVDNVTAWVNGVEAIKLASTYRSLYRADRHRSEIDLKGGENTILLKLTKTPPEEGGRPGALPKWDFQVRFVGPNGRGISFSQTEGAK